MLSREWGLTSDLFGFSGTEPCLLWHRDFRQTQRLKEKWADKAIGGQREVSEKNNLYIYISACCIWAAVGGSSLQSSQINQKNLRKIYWLSYPAIRSLFDLLTCMYLCLSFQSIWIKHEPSVVCPQFYRRALTMHLGYNHLLITAGQERWSERLMSSLSAFLKCLLVTVKSFLCNSPSSFPHCHLSGIVLCK